MRKNYLMIGVMAVALLAGCAQSHTHQLGDVWNADWSKHWKSCEGCEQRVGEETHTLDDSDTCNICGAQVIDWGDGKSLYQFNESGDPLKLADYDTDGNVLTETVYQYEYDAEGKLTHSTTITDGVVTEENTYLIVDDQPIVSQCISYMDDGTKSVSDYDVNGNGIRMTAYDADGKLTLQTESEYALSTDGQWYESKCTTTEENGTKTVSTFADNGDQLYIAYYDAEGTLENAESWVYTYDEEGNWKTMQHYRNDILVSDTVYAVADTVDGSVTYPETVTQYEEDGSRTTTVYDENDQILSQVRYDADGNVIS